ncbi:DNA protecting protein DprA [Halospina denitrificans]|uniref:DNA protecting protein DprA n=1 Tax=Halospina denitrificans TaxID=332522 RepID=A0A4R7JZW3_9GAMM|nr:DNA-processing protein DprA [Halospina denitrificans]TDT44092.1 DNA protecting protein DprA [Halospina denitrificans]
MTVTERPPAAESLDKHHILALLPGMKPDHWQVVLDQLDDPVQLLQLPPTSLKALSMPAGARRLIGDWQRGHMDSQWQERLEQIRHKCRSRHIQVVDWCDPRYPESLRHIHGPPPVLYLRGNPGALSRPCLAMVGSRHASRDGLNHAAGFARALAEQGIAVVSGLALGVDGAAHRGALEASGVTLGVLANGVDTPYPRQHGALATEILNNGALVSELPPGTPARAHLFPQRNRIISGLCRGVLVVEAGVRSGSLITARLAMEQGREVFAIPGSIHNPGVRGCHRLIRAGAVLVETLEDILTELADWGLETLETGSGATPPGPDPESLEPSARQLLDVLTYEPRSSDQLCEDTGLAAAELLQTLLTLEMEGFAEATPGGYRKRAG